MISCPSCGALNSDDSSFCRHCGTALPGRTGYPAEDMPNRSLAPGIVPPSPPIPGQPQAGPGPGIQFVPRNSGKATASLICGILGLIVFPLIFSVLAIVLGQAAKNEISNSGGQLTGAGSATAGIVLGIIGLVFWVIFLAVTFAL
ncbi:MAG: DUF4190 domain-containing protein [Candidatus Geothermincolales bacterium]